MAASSAPVLSTPAEHILEVSYQDERASSKASLTEEQLYVQYEIKRTIAEIRQGKWKRVALQFPDDMLVDAPRVFERLRDGLRHARQDSQHISNATATSEPQVSQLGDKLAAVDISSPDGQTDLVDSVEERLYILGDTSYGACCVDEVAAEHVDADVVVHYGRACLSPTARLPVIYVFTSRPANLDGAVAAFTNTYPDKAEQVCLLADIPYLHHIPALQERLEGEGYTNVFATEVVRDPSSPLPNRTIPPRVKDRQESLADYNVFHLATPPTSLLLTLSSRVKAVHILPVDPATGALPTSALEASTSQTLRRRYALVTRVNTVPIFGILVNTLSVANYMQALTHCQHLISRAGKKSYVFIVGKVNAAKVANFSEIGGWVVIGCWESSLIENQDFYRPLITPFELEVALTSDESRTWSGQWISDFSALLGREESHVENGSQDNGSSDLDSEDEPPEFDLRTGKYVSHSRPMRKSRKQKSQLTDSASEQNRSSNSSQALIRKAKGDVAVVGNQLSPAAQFLREQRTWQGLGSDHAIAYERDVEGKIIGAPVEEGRSGVAKGYTVGPAESKS